MPSGIGRGMGVMVALVIFMGDLSLLVFNFLFSGEDEEVPSEQ